MPSTKQRLVIGRILADPSQTLYSAMIASGYSHNTAKAPGKNLVNRESFQDLLEEYLPDDMLLGALKDDIQTKKGNRSKELDLAFKVKGKLTPNVESQSTYNTQININDATPRGQEMVDQFTEYMRQQTLPKGQDVSTQD